MNDIPSVEPGIYCKIVNAFRPFDSGKIIYGDSSKKPIGIATEAKNRRTTVKPETIKNIEAILSKGDRVELIPVKDGIRVVRIRREPVK